MTDDNLLNRVSLGDGEWSVTPDPEHLVPDQYERDRRTDEFQARLQEIDATNTPIIITHTDADGLSSAALLAFDHGEKDAVIQPVEYHGAYTLRNALFDILCTDSIEDAEIYITDLNPNESSDIHHIDNLIDERSCSVTWYDHHQWDDGLRETVEDYGVDLVIDEDECTASLIGMERDPDGEWPRRVHDLVQVTKDRDLWIRHDPRSERLAVFAEIAEPTDYVETVLEHGPDLPDDTMDSVEDRLGDLELLEQMAVDRRADHTIGGYDIAVTYTSDGRSSEIGNALVEDDAPWGVYDIAVVLKSHGGMGVYSHSDRETFARCHEIASALGGGGHPTASGADVPVETFRDLAQYWASAGVSVHGDLLETIHEVVTGGDQDDD